MQCTCSTQCTYADVLNALAPAPCDFFPSCTTLPMCCRLPAPLYSLMHLRNRITYPTTGFRWKLPTKRVCVECAELNYRPNVWWSFFGMSVRLFGTSSDRNEIFNCIMHENSLRKQYICIWWQRSGLPTATDICNILYAAVVCLPQSRPRRKCFIIQVNMYICALRVLVHIWETAAIVCAISSM